MGRNTYESNPNSLSCRSGISIEGVYQAAVLPTPHVHPSLHPLLNQPPYTPSLTPSFNPSSDTRTATIKDQIQN